MSSLKIADKTFLENVLAMRSGYVLDFTDGSFANFFDQLNIDIYDNDHYPGFGTSKANRLRALWKNGSDAQVSAALLALAEYIEATQAGGELLEDVSEEQIAKIRDIGLHLSPAPSLTDTWPVAVTTGATVTNDTISIEIHPDIFSHIRPYLATGDYFHAVEEAYKVVREKLREMTGSDKATDVFNQSAQSDKHYEVLFGKSQPTDPVEADFFRGVGYLHLGIQFLRNEKAHSLAAPIEPNLAVHYLSLASLSYDLVTKNVSEQTIQEIEQLVRDKRLSYRTATAFYRDYANHHWLETLELPKSMTYSHVRQALKTKWLREADLTRGFDSSNIVFMRFELVADQLTPEDIDLVLDLPTVNRYGMDQAAGLEGFLEFIQQMHPQKFSARAKARLDELKQD